MEFKKLPPVKEQLMKCVRCGRCRTVCPVFAEIKKESAAPRGHVFMVGLLRDGEMEPTNEVLERLGNCLLCETCSTFCPSGIDIHELNVAARTFIADKNPSTGRDLIFDTMWTRPQALRTGTRLAAAAQRLGLQKAARTIGLTRVLPGDLPKAERIAENIPLRTARGQLQEISPAYGQRRMRVAYFLGCGTDIFNPEVALATVRVLTRLGCEVVIPRDMKCCGLPHVANGKLDTARKLAVHNARVFSSLDVDYVITDCASCSSALSVKHMHFLLDGTDYLDEALTFARRCVDLTVFLVDILGVSESDLHPVPNTRVTYHDACHLAKAQGIRRPPREILKMIPGVTLVEMKEPDRCCGGSGTFSMTHYDLSMKVLQHKMDNIMATGADTVATCCPSCSLQLRHGISRNNYKATVKHPVELLDRALATNKQRLPGSHSPV